MPEVGQSEIPIGLKVGEYEITGLLGKGGMGTVYAGVHPVIGKEVAIKVLSNKVGESADLVARFIQEARAVNRIGHPNIIDVFSFGELPELGHYYVMPRLRGSTLTERIQLRGKLAIDEALAILAQIAEALDAAHAVGIFHRDLKPDNIFLVPRRRGGFAVKVLDFGIAKLNDGGAMTVTKTGVPMGTPMFMSPEQWEGIDVDHRTDVYALGVLLHHMVTGEFPFSATTQVALMRQHCDAPPALPSQHGGPPQLDPVVARALAKDRERRYSSTLELVAAARTAMAGGQVTAPAPPARAAQTPRPATALGAAPRRRWLLALAVLVLLGAGGGLIAALESGGGQPSVAAVDAATPVAAAPPIDASPATPQVQPPDAAPPTPDAAPPVRVSVKLVSRPSGAAVLGGHGERLGVTPVTLELEKSKRPLEVLLKKEGYVEQTISVQRDRSGRRTIRLRRWPGAGKPHDDKSSWGETGSPFDSGGK